MKYTAATLTALLMTSGVAAANTLMQNTQQPTSKLNVISLIEETKGKGNVIELTETGTSNSLSLSQLHHQNSLSDNLMIVSILGDSNGRSPGALFTGASLDSGLEPGWLSQAGSSNTMRVDVNGNDNLFAFLQSGTNNSLSANIEGTGNQASVQQYGQNNHVSFSQTGTGNRINISQRSF